VPDPLDVFKAVAVALFASALMGAVGHRFSGGRPSGWVWSLAIGTGAYLGLATLGIRPRWPIREDQHRLLGLVMPAILLIEAAGGALRPPRWLILGGRLAASLAVAPVILYGSIYVADLAGPKSAEWSPARRWLIFSGLGLALFGVWSCLVRTQRQSGSSVRTPLALAMAIAGAGLTVMLSGYASGGLVGLPLAGAIAGAVATAAWWREDALGAAHGVGVGVVGLFSVLAIGFFFGRLRVEPAILLFLSPLLAAIAEAPLPFRLARGWRSAAGLALVAIVVGLVVVSTARRFAVDAGLVDDQLERANTFWAVAASESGS